MIPDNIKLLSEALIRFVGIHPRDAQKTAFNISEYLENNGYSILETDREDEEIPF